MGRERSMRPGTRLALSAAVAAVVLVAAAHGVMAALVGTWWMGWTKLVLLAIAPAAALAAWLAAWSISAWHGGDGARRWSPLGMAARAVVLAFVLYPVFMIACQLAVHLLDQVFAAQPATFGDAWPMMRALALYAWLLGLALGALPALVIGYFLCRRYLRVTATTGQGAA